jgi:hypothetical protein
VNSTLTVVQVLTAGAGVSESGQNRTMSQDASAQFVLVKLIRSNGQKSIYRLADRWSRVANSTIKFVVSVSGISRLSEGENRTSSSVG